MSNQSRNFTRKIEPIEERFITFIGDRNLVVLRDAKTHKALNVSTTEDGLKWTYLNNRQGLCYFKNGKFQRNLEVDKHGNLKGFVNIVSNDNKPLTKSSKIYVEKFIPRNHDDLGNQKAEYVWVNKALRLLNLNAGAFEA